MTALAGIFSRDRADVGPTQRMTASMHRGFASVADHRQFPDFGLSVGWVHEPANFTDALPVWSADRRQCLIFVGEEYSVARAADPATSPEDAAAALLTAYGRERGEFFSRLNGIFCGLLIDRARGTATLFNDRYGLGRVYYAETPAGLFFATEAKALLAVLPEMRRLDRRGMAESLTCGCVLQNRTLFRDVHLLPPGAAWTFHVDGRVEKRRYFDPAVWEGQEPLSAPDYGALLREVFARIAPRYMTEPSRVALSLTGGLDSRAIIAWLRAPPGTLPCYTFGGPYRDCADVVIARQLAELGQLPHATIRIGDDFFADFPALAETVVHLTDGAMDVSGAVELHVNRSASGVAPIRLTGNYGSEILREHVALRPRQLNRTTFAPEFCPLLDEALATYAMEARCHRLSFIAFKQMPWHHYARRAVERSAVTPRSPFLDNELVALAYRAPLELRGSPQPMLDLIAAGNPAMAAVPTDRALHAGARPILGGFANRVREFTSKAEYAYDYGMPHWLARADHVVSKLHLERLFLGRHKFYHFRIWYRDRLREYVRAQAAAGVPEPFYLRTGVASRLAAEHLAGHANHTLALHALFTAQLTERLFGATP